MIRIDFIFHFYSPHLLHIIYHIRKQIDITILHARERIFLHSSSTSLFLINRHESVYLIASMTEFSPGNPLLVLFNYLEQQSIMYDPHWLFDII
jgi:hypothetical protein